MTTMHDLLPLQSPLLSSTKFAISTLMFLGDFYTSTASVASAVGQSVTTSSTDFSFQNLVFWNLFEFTVAEIISKSISPTF